MHDETRTTAVDAPEVVIVGGGVAAAETLLALRAVAPDPTAPAVALVAPGEWLTYRPLAVREPFGDAPPRRYRLADICADQGATLVRGIVARVDADRRVAVLASGERLRWDALVIAAGGRTQPTLPGAETFMPDDDPGRLRPLLDELAAGRVRRLAFVATAASRWQLPLYELALLTARWLRDRGIDGVALTVVTVEPRPLAVFRGAGADAVARLLADAGIAVVADVHASKVEGGALWLVPGPRRLPVDRVVALPRIDGPAIGGLPRDGDGFIRVDGDGRVPDRPDVYAVGDATAFPLKQGGLAAHQADRVAALVARAAGVDVPLPPARPLLRALLLTGDGPLFLEATIAGGVTVTSRVSRTPLWAPPDKIAAHHLGRYLATRTAQRPARPTALDRDRAAIAREQAGRRPPRDR